MEKDPKLIALLFNQYINEQKLDKLVSLMTDSHSFISLTNKAFRGRDEMRSSWKRFFELYPGYRNIFHTVISRDNLVIMLGYSVCPNEKELDGPAIWTATIEDEKLAQWRIYDDTEENRRGLGIN